MINLNIRIFVVLGLVLAAGVFLVHAAMAEGGPSSVPGWGFGDTNHVHTGPPGQSVRP